MRKIVDCKRAGTFVPKGSARMRCRFIEGNRRVFWPEYARGLDLPNSLREALCALRASVFRFGKIKDRRRSFKAQVVSFKRRRKKLKKKRPFLCLRRTWNRMFQGRTGTAIPSHMKKKLLLRSTIHDLQSYMIRVHSCPFAVRTSLQESALRPASPYRQKRQDSKKQDSREEVGSPSFTCPSK